MNVVSIVNPNKFVSPPKFVRQISDLPAKFLLRINRRRATLSSCKRNLLKTYAVAKISSMNFLAIVGVTVLIAHSRRYYSIRFHYFLHGSNIRDKMSTSVWCSLIQFMNFIVVAVVSRGKCFLDFPIDPAKKKS